jgi:hypothetical protein
MAKVEAAKGKLDKEEYQCMDCGKKREGIIYTDPKGLKYDLIPHGWAMHIRDDGDYLLICDGCVLKNC